MFFRKMVGIFKKIKDGLNWIKNKVVKNVLPYVGKLGDIVDSDALQSVIKAIGPAADAFIPGLGTGINAARNFISNAGNVARTLTKTGGFANVPNLSNKFANVPNLSNKFANVPNLAKRPDQLHDRIQLKALPPPEDDGLGID
ncbi:hypothetical protein FACS189472_05930 [Alphaproteobacteria bacterium]|nr:hypothetical protein FACS189472_05930 [Alphaproteobacteria bacterium]